MAENLNEKVPVAMADGIDGIPTIILGIPKAAWEYARDGKTHTFDLTKAGIPVRILIFGGEDREQVMQTMNDVAVMLTGAEAENMPAPGEKLPDLGVDDPVKH